MLTEKDVQPIKYLNKRRADENKRQPSKIFGVAGKESGRSRNLNNASKISLELYNKLDLFAEMCHDYAYLLKQDNLEDNRHQKICDRQRY